MQCGHSLIVSASMQIPQPCSTSTTHICGFLLSCQGGCLHIKFGFLPERLPAACSCGLLRMLIVRYPYSSACIIMTSKLGLRVGIGRMRCMSFALPETTGEFPQLCIRGPAVLEQLKRGRPSPKMSTW